MAWYKPWTWGDESESAVDKRNQLSETGLASNQFAEFMGGGIAGLDSESAGLRQRLTDQSMGKGPSLAAEQLRQGLGQQLGQQRSMAASANPTNAAMAARIAANNMGRASFGMSGQAAQARLMEQQQAQQALAQMLMQQRGQNIQGALGGRQTAVGAYGGVTPEGSFIDKYGAPIAAGLGMAAKSDERAKTNIKDGDEAANKAMAKLGTYTFDYKDEKDGKGNQLGVMAQQLEKAGLKHAVIDTPSGKYVHGPKLETSNTAMIAALGRRLAKVEGKK